ncbi:MAG: hypothetical protein KDC18_01215 [Alphaproteobacteria bacterium]|nr:hypothetical protein [Alphaproteobacteria bacterium]MCB9928231.1 hypothetical protein [Alphaproteobacteria bacterium]
MPNDRPMVREAVGVFGDADSLQAAIDELQSAGFGRVDLNLMAGEDAVREKLGHIYRRVEDAEDDPEAPRADYIAPESRGDAEGGLIGALSYIGAVAAAGAVFASGGTLAAAIAGATAIGATGALVGTVLAGMLDLNHARYIQTQLDHGGLLLWVHIRDRAHEQQATDILRRHSAKDVHVHDIEA